jgi:hypothetical protein
MTELARGTCVPCRAGVPTLTDAEIVKLRPQGTVGSAAMATGSRSSDARRPREITPPIIVQDPRRTPESRHSSKRTEEYGV